MLACGGSAGGCDNRDEPPGLEAEGVLVFGKVGYWIGAGPTAEPFAN